MIVWAVFCSIITYIDRVCISQAKPYIIGDLHLTDNDWGTVLSAFVWSYALFEIPTGWLGDKYGARSTLTRVVVWWSAFTAATALAWNFASLVTIRFLFGIGEAGCFPNITKAFTVWLPERERVRAQGINWMCARWGGAFTPLLVGWILGWVDWRTAFVLFGVLGFLWAIGFYRWFRDDPREHKDVNAAEVAPDRGGRQPFARARGYAVGQDAGLGARVAAVAAVFRHLLQLVFLHHLAAGLHGQETAASISARMPG